jgi:hypothetical protein
VRVSTRTARPDATSPHAIAIVSSERPALSRNFDTENTDVIGGSDDVISGGDDVIGGGDVIMALDVNS